MNIILLHTPFSPTNRTINCVHPLHRTEGWKGKEQWNNLLRECQTRLVSSCLSLRVQAYIWNTFHSAVCCFYANSFNEGHTSKATLNGPSHCRHLWILFGFQCPRTVSASRLAVEVKVWLVDLLTNVSLSLNGCWSWEQAHSLEKDPFCETRHF